MLDYSYPLFRPPAEANNLILQVTHGCSYNKCSFCSMYKTKKFSIKPLKEVFEEIDEIAKYYPNTIKIFLADGDALTLSTEHLLEILRYIKKSFPKIRRVSTYASTQNILAKSIDELKLLKENGLNLFYYGIESGDDEVLSKIAKGVDSQQIIKSLHLAYQANIKISATMILGIGGKDYSKQHIINTAKLINQVHINYLSTLQLGLEENQRDSFYSKFENFEHLSDSEILEEQKEFISNLSPKCKIIFRSNHASNALALEGTLPKDKDRLLQDIQETLEIGESAFIPKFMRGF